MSQTSYKRGIKFTYVKTGSVMPMIRIKVASMMMVFSVIVGLLLPRAALADDKRVVISLSQETLTAYDGNTIFLQTPVTTGGLATPTPAGTYQVIGKYSDFIMHSPWPPSDWRWYPDSFVDYGLLFQANGYFIHDAPWRGNFGVGSDTVLGTPGGSYTGTHGCVNVPFAAEASLFAWAFVGTTVIIQP